MKGILLHRFQSLTAFLAFSLVSLHVYAQATQPPTSQFAQATSNPTYSVTQIAGLSSVPADIKGDLSLSPTSLQFTSPSLHVEVPLSRIQTISIGSERMETGGAAGLLLRLAAPPVGAVTQKKAALLTIEYRDERGGYHAAVFATSKEIADDLQGQLSPRLTAGDRALTPPCDSQNKQPAAILLAPIAVSDLQLPPEYRALLYEEMVAKIHRLAPSIPVVRAGDRSSGPGCTGMTLQLTVTGFKKGNRAIRSTTGPIGFFTANTALSVHIDLTDSSERTLISTQTSSNNRIDRESLDTASLIATTVSKKVVKATATYESGKKSS